MTIQRWYAQRMLIEYPQNVTIHFIIGIVCIIEVNVIVTFYEVILINWNCRFGKQDRVGRVEVSKVGERFLQIDLVSLVLFGPKQVNSVVATISLPLRSLLNRSISGAVEKWSFVPRKSVMFLKVIADTLQAGGDSWPQSSRFLCLPLSYLQKHPSFRHCQN